MGSWELSLSRVWILSLRSDFWLLRSSKEEENAYIESKNEMTSFWKSFQKPHKNAPYYAPLPAELGRRIPKVASEKGNLRPISAPLVAELGRRNGTKIATFWSLSAPCFGGP